jgi:hypothetical protein
MKITRSQLKRIIKEELSRAQSKILIENSEIELAKKDIDSAVAYFVKSIRSVLEGKGLEYVDLDWKGDDDNKFKIETGDSSKSWAKKFISVIPTSKEACRKANHRWTDMGFEEGGDKALFKWTEPDGFVLKTSSSGGCSRIGTQWGHPDRGPDLEGPMFLVTLWTEKDVAWYNSISPEAPLGREIK